MRRLDRVGDPQHRLLDIIALSRTATGVDGKDRDKSVWRAHDSVRARRALLLALMTVLCWLGRV